MPPFDNWVTVFAGVCAALAVVLVPLTGFLKTFFDYQIETRKAEGRKPEIAREIAVQPGGAAMYDTIGTADHTAALKGLVDAVKDLAAAIREETKFETEQHSNEVTTALKKLMTRMDRFDDDENPTRRTPHR